jgi:hypothetical protein
MKRGLQNRWRNIFDPTDGQCRLKPVSAKRSGAPALSGGFKNISEGGGLFYLTEVRLKRCTKSIRGW